jgi:hypothetical protein
LPGWPSARQNRQTIIQERKNKMTDTTPETQTTMVQPAPQSAIADAWPVQWRPSHLLNDPEPQEPEMESVEEAATDPAKALLDTLIKSRRFNPDIVPPPLRPIYTLGGVCISTPGNLGTVTAPVKAGKSAGFGAMIASVMGPEGNDYLGFESDKNPDGKALLYFDTEQSPEDFWHCIYRALLRAGLHRPPPWFYATCLTGFGFRQSWDCINRDMEVSAQNWGGLHSVIMDGYGDLVADVNDAPECNDRVANLHGLTIKYDCPIVGAIHFNPNSEKARGHLGSELERKAETNLVLNKDGEVTSMWSEKQRRAPIPKGKGPCFAWNDEAGMHVSVESPAQAPKKGRVRKDPKEETMKLVPEEGPIEKGVLASKVMWAAEMGQGKVEGAISVLLSEGRLFEWKTPRPGGGRKIVSVARTEQPKTDDKS